MFSLGSRETSGQWVDGVVNAWYTSADEGEQTRRTRRREPNYLRQLMFENFDFFTSFRRTRLATNGRTSPRRNRNTPNYFVRHASNYQTARTGSRNPSSRILAQIGSSRQLFRVFPQNKTPPFSTNARKRAEFLPVQAVYPVPASKKIRQR